MTYEVAIAVSTVLISFILIYISTMLNKNDYPGFQFLFFSMGLIFIIISIFTCVVIATENSNTDLSTIYSSALTGMSFLFVLVILFFLFKYWKQLMAALQGKTADEDD